MDGGAVLISVIIPTRNRPGTLCETLRRLELQHAEGDADFEVVVADDGSTQDTASVLRRPWRMPLSSLHLEGTGPARARNEAIRRARGAVCLFLNDDCWPLPGLLARHAEFHRRATAPGAALLGGVIAGGTPPPTAFVTWLHALHFGFEAIADRADAGGERFCTANLSAKTAFVREAGGFDESFPLAAHEDVDLGLRLERRGLRLAYDPAAAVEHCHPTDLRQALGHFRRIGASAADLARRHPSRGAPRRPGLRHRVGSGVLFTATLLLPGHDGLRREVWRFLVHEAHREGFWEGPDASTAVPHIGARLARLSGRSEPPRP